MKKSYSHFILVTLVFSLLIVPANADTLRVVTYNALNFATNDTDRLDEFLITMEAIHPDVAVFQEIIDEGAVDNLLSFVFLQIDDDWASAEFENGPDTDNAMLYRTSRVTLADQRIIPTSLRDITEFKLFAAELDTTEPIKIYSAHLKASSGAENEQRRLEECTALRQQLNFLPAGALFMMVGDFNLYTSEEPAYQYLLSAGTNSNGQLFDPIDSPGSWNNSVSFAPIHTQSPRTQSFGGGSTGGMDDRFDFILVSAGLMDTAGSYVLPETYTPFGNDGQHFNQAINDGVNNAVPDSVADALMYGSDHLPVFTDFYLRPSTTGVSDLPIVPQSHQLITCYPNPFNAILNIEPLQITGDGRLQVFDIHGREIMRGEISGGSRSRAQLDFSANGNGIYFVKFTSPEQSATVKVVLLK